MYVNLYIPSITKVRPPSVGTQVGDERYKPQTPLSVKSSSDTVEGRVKHSGKVHPGARSVYKICLLLVFNRTTGPSTLTEESVEYTDP